MDLADFPEYTGFFEHATQGRLAFPHCPHCRRYHWYPLPRCPHCNHATTEWAPVTGKATLYSWTEVRYAFSEDMADAVPYIIAVVAFADAPDIRFVTRLTGVSTQDVQIGMTLTPVFPAADDPSKLVFFRAAS